MKILMPALLGIVLSNPTWAETPLGLPTPSIPADNLQTDDKISLGSRLFNDNRFSADQTISCASCHPANNAFTDGLANAIGIKGQTGTRNTPTVINTAYYEKLFLDGRRNSLEQQVLDPFTNKIEHGLDNHQQIIDIIQQDPRYLTQFNQVFGVKPDAITIAHVSKSIASYLRSLITGNSAFDRYLFGRDKSALSPSAARGLKIFRRKGNCANCHEISWDHALFTDNRFYNIGIGMEYLEPVLDKIMSSKQAGIAMEKLNLSALQKSELGRFQVTHIISDIGKFKTPILRNISQTSPYMHDGRFKTLEQVVDYYNKGGDKNRFLDPAIYPLHLSDQDKMDLVEFMKSLDSSQLF